MGRDRVANAKILYVGDMHLGRAPTRLPDALQEFGLAPPELGPAAAWRATVDYACAQGVDAVVLAGDVVEADNSRYEAYGHLKQGVDKLIAGGVTVCAVAGNHDVEVLPKMAAAIDEFHLLGAAGTWSSLDISHGGTPAVRLVGWSFPVPHVTTSPLASGLPALPADELPVLGVLHCDLDAPSSPYAPVKSAELSAAKLAGWFLGHIHKPSLAGEGPPVGYLGSLVGLDPTETGRHGPWLVEIAPSGRVSLRQVPLAPLRWERIEVSVAELDDPRHDLLTLLGGRLQRCQKQLFDELADVENGGRDLRAVGCRVHFTGRTVQHRELARTLNDPELARFVVPSDGVLMFLAGLPVNDTTPDRDLKRLSRGEDPPALLARQLLALQANRATGTALLQEARRELLPIASHRNLLALSEWEASDAELRELLLQAGFLALEELLAQREGQS
jgi:DNA repair exonuclease SbcCD nuclease subunit